MAQSQTSPPTSREALGIGRVLSSGTSLALRNGGFLLLVPFVIYIPAFLVQFIIFDVLWDRYSGDSVSSLLPFTEIFELGILPIHTILAALIMALLTASLLNVSSGEGLNPVRSIQAVAAVMVPIAVLSILAGLLTGLGFLMLIVPGLYLSAMFAVYIPVLLDRKAGLSALTQSSVLTKGYRWAIVVILIVVGVITFGASLLVELVTEVTGFGNDAFVLLELDAPQLPDLAYNLIYAVFAAASASVTAAVNAAVAVSLYHRLLEIKKGGSVEALREVFA